MTVDELKSFAKSKGIILPPLQSKKYFTSIISFMYFYIRI